MSIGALMNCRGLTELMALIITAATSPALSWIHRGKGDLDPAGDQSGIGQEESVLESAGTR